MKSYDKCFQNIVIYNDKNICECESNLIKVGQGCYKDKLISDVNCKDGKIESPCLCGKNNYLNIDGYCSVNGDNAKFYESCPDGHINNKCWCGSECDKGSNCDFNAQKCTSSSKDSS